MHDALAFGSHSGHLLHESPYFISEFVFPEILQSGRYALPALHNLFTRIDENFLAGIGRGTSPRQPFCYRFSLRAQIRGRAA